MNTHALDRSIEFITSWLAFRYKKEEIPGFVVAIAQDGKLLMNEAYGYADVENKVPLTPQHIFRIASHSKTFTATALMQLQEKGLLRLDDYIVEYLPWLKEHSDAKWQKITLRQLMSHGAGVIRDGLNSDYWQLERPFPTQEELKREILKADVVIDNNVRHKYSNFGYSLLGMVVESVSGKSYNDFVSENIVNPLELQNTGPEYTSAIDNKIVVGYTNIEPDRSRLPIANIDTRSMAAATGFYSNTEDLCVYFSAQLVGSGKLLDDESKKEMQRTHWHTKTPGQGNHEDYGLGLEIEYLKNRVVFGHGGGFPGQITQSFVDPKDKLVVVVLTNCLGGPAASIAKSIYSIIDFFRDNTPEQNDGYDLTGFEGRFMSLWSKTQFIAAKNKVIEINPNTWHPLTNPDVLEKLEYVNKTTLKIIDTGSFYSEGELIHFNFENGEVETINHSGTTMWPEKVWDKKQAERKKVG